jgi:hypothetical protein
MPRANTHAESEADHGAHSLEHEPENEIRKRTWFLTMEVSIYAPGVRATVLAVIVSCIYSTQAVTYLPIYVNRAHT